MRIYLAGPMRGIPSLNHPAFAYAAAKLRAEGHEVFSPPEVDIEFFGEDFLNNPDYTIDNCMKIDCEWICRNAEAIALLPGWENSKGANAELALSKALDLTVMVLGKKFVLPKEPG